MKQKLTEERILQITNDISEDMGKPTDKELRAVVKYWSLKHSILASEHHHLSSLVSNYVGVESVRSALLKSIEDHVFGMSKMKRGGP